MKKSILAYLSTLMVLGLLAGCNLETMDVDSSKQAAELGATTPSLRVDFELWKEGTPRQLIYSMKNGVETKNTPEGFKIVTDGQYSLNISSTLPDVPLQLVMPMGTVALRQGSNAIPTAYTSTLSTPTTSLPIQAKINNVWANAQAPITAAVTCAASASGPVVMNANQISVSGGNNVYTYSAAGVASGGSGQFNCAWDFNGDGIQDSAFAPCERAIITYSNHVDNRLVGVYVKDRCNPMTATSMTTMVRALPAPASLAKPTVFVMGTISGAGALSTEKGVNLRHVSTNPANPENPARPFQGVICNYGRTNGQGTFTVQGLWDYPLSTSQQHGLELSVIGIVDNLNLTTGAGSVSAGPSPSFSRVNFKTDEAPDVKARMEFEGAAQCTLTGFNVAAMPDGGVPCASAANGVAPAYVVEGEGSFSCINLPSKYASGGAIHISNGSFYCRPRLVDQCIGGGGGGGGGVDPQQF